MNKSEQLEIRSPEHVVELPGETEREREKREGKRMRGEGGYCGMKGT